MPTIPRSAPRRFPQRIALAVALAALCFLPATLARGADSPSGVTHALLLNGGDKPSSNYQSHLHHLEEMVELLKDRGVERKRISIFSADGEDVAADLAVRDTLPGQFWLLDGISLGKRLKPRSELTNTRWGGVKLYPARKAALREWFAASPERLAPGDELLLFVTDHGNGNKDDPDNGTISLWKQKLSVRELKGLLKLLPSGVRTVMVMSQCFSGTFANAMYDGADSEASGDICGFFSTTRNLRAYGCYPEGRDRDRIGHAFQFIDALGRHPTAAAAHREVLLTDRTPDVPLRTSDVYIERLLRAFRGQSPIGKRRRKTSDRHLYCEEVIIIQYLTFLSGHRKPTKPGRNRETGCCNSLIRPHLREVPHITPPRSASVSGS